MALYVDFLVKGTLPLVRVEERTTADQITSHQRVSFRIICIVSEDCQQNRKHPLTSDDGQARIRAWRSSPA